MSAANNKVKELEAKLAAASPAVGEEEIIQRLIDAAPEPLKTLGERLADWLDEDHWNNAEQYLLSLAAILSRTPAQPDNRVAELEAECQHSMKTIAEERRRAEKAEASLAKARKVIEFYADPKTYEVRGHIQIDADTPPINSDCGRTARDWRERNKEPQS